MKTNYSKNIGSVSTATMREEDLIPTFISELRSMKPLHRKDSELIRDIEAHIRRNEDYFQSEDAGYDLEALFEALEAYALPYFYFGSHPSDGSDYGFWLSEFFEQDFEGLKVSDLSEVPTGFSGEVLLVNDHGNTSLYTYSRGRGREVWAVV